MTHWNFFPLRPRRKRNGIGSLIEITRAQSLIFNALAKSTFSSVSFNGSPKSTNARGCRRSASSSLTQRLFSLNYKHHEEDAQKNLRKHRCCFSQAHREAMIDRVALYRKKDERVTIAWTSGQRSAFEMPVGRERERDTSIAIRERQPKYFRPALAHYWHIRSDVTLCARPCKWERWERMWTIAQTKISCQ